MVPLDQVKHYIEEPLQERSGQEVKKKKKLGWSTLKSLQGGVQRFINAKSSTKTFMNAKQLAQLDCDECAYDELEKLMRYAKEQRASDNWEKRWLVSLPKIPWERYKEKIKEKKDAYRDKDQDKTKKTKLTKLQKLVYTVSPPAIGSYTGFCDECARVLRTTR
eukprot:1654735-Pyramimonas_sp.AAC.2